jgi:hypothetical protein
MSRRTRSSGRFVPALLRAVAFCLLLSAPVLALPMVDGGPKGTIEAPMKKVSGAGLVLLVSLQRG